jgi:hypothetical protein
MDKSKGHIKYCSQQNCELHMAVVEITFRGNFE